MSGRSWMRRVGAGRGPRTLRGRLTEHSLRCHLPRAGERPRAHRGRRPTGRRARLLLRVQPRVHRRILAAVEEGWGSGVTLPLAYPSGAGDAAVLEWWVAWSAWPPVRARRSPPSRWPTRSTPSPASRPPGPHAGAPPGPGPTGERRDGPLPGRPHPEAATSSWRVDHLPWFGDATPRSARSRVPDGLPPAPRRGPGTGDRAVHRHRRFHRAGGEARRPRWRELLDDHDRLVRRELAGSGAGR